MINGYLNNLFAGKNKDKINPLLIIINKTKTKITIGKEYKFNIYPTIIDIKEIKIFLKKLAKDIKLALSLSLIKLFNKTLNLTLKMPRIT